MRVCVFACVCVRVHGCVCYAKAKGVAKVLESCSELTDQYCIVLGNKHWLFSFVNLLKRIINPGAVCFSPSSLHAHTQLPPVTCMCQQKLSLTAAVCAGTTTLGFGGKKKKKKACGIEHLHNNVSVRFVSMSAIHSLREDL